MLVKWEAVITFFRTQFSGLYSMSKPTLTIRADLCHYVWVIMLYWGVLACARNLHIINERERTLIISNVWPYNYIIIMYDHIIIHYFIDIKDNKIKIEPYNGRQKWKAKNCAFVITFTISILADAILVRYPHFHKKWYILIKKNKLCMFEKVHNV